MMEPITLVLLLTLLVFLYFWIQYRYSKTMRFVRSLPTGVSTIPLLGSLHHFIFDKEPQSALVNVIKRIDAMNLRLHCFWFGPKPMVVLNDPKDVEILLSSSKYVDKGQSYKLLKFGVGEGLLTAETSIWRITRRYMTSLFHARNLDHLVSVFNKTSQELVQHLSTKVGDAPIDIATDLKDFTVKNTICLVFGTKFEGVLDSETVTDMRKTISMGNTIGAERTLRIWLTWDFIFYYFYGEKIKYILTLPYRMPKSIIEVIEDCKNFLQKNISSVEVDGRHKSAHSIKQGGNKFPVTLPEIYKTLKGEHPQFKGKDFIYEMMTLYSAGTDTTSLTLANCLLALAAHPHIQIKVYNEICEEVGKEAGMVTTEDVRKLRYMDCVLKETLRRFTIGPYITRTITSELQLGDYTMPPGTQVVVNIVGMHNNPRLFPDPERFDPDRFNAENAETRHKFAYLAFSGGVRDCIGKRYAWTIMKVVLVHLLREYELTTSVDINKIKASFDLLLRSEDSHFVSLKKRIVN